MNCGSGETLSNRPMAKVSQTIQPLPDWVLLILLVLPWGLARWPAWRLAVGRRAGLAEQAARRARG
ncbi:hypothetical protein D3C87_2067270 [compost metagenome]